MAARRLQAPAAHVGSETRNETLPLGPCRGAVIVPPYVRALDRTVYAQKVGSEVLTCAAVADVEQEKGVYGVKPAPAAVELGRALLDIWWKGCDLPPWLVPECDLLLLDQSFAHGVE